jgi:uncharacterized membrane protein YhaH (DUF805 family)
MWKLAQEALRTAEFCGKIQLSRGRKYMDWIITPFQRALDFKGRSRRKEYWLFVLFSIIVAIALCSLFAFMGGFDINASDILTPIGETLAPIFIVVYMLIFIFPSISISIRRWHDLGYTGWLFLLSTVLGNIPLLGVLVTIGNIIWFCMPGTVGPNKYGDDPLDAPYQGYIH